jgi:hypothetical protein
MSSTHGASADVSTSPEASKNYSDNFDSIFGKRKLNVQTVKDVKSEEKESTEDLEKSSDK